MFIKYDSNNTIKRLNCRHLGVYEIFDEIDVNTKTSNTHISMCIVIQKLHKDDYIILNSKEKGDLRKHYTTAKLESVIQKRLNYAFKGNPYPDVTVFYVAKTEAEYENINKQLDIDFNMENIINALRDNIWLIKGINRKVNTDLSILFIKRDNQFFIINRSDSNWSEELSSAKKIAATASLMFGFGFTIKQIKI